MKVLPVVVKRTLNDQQVDDEDQVLHLMLVLTEGEEGLIK